MGLLRTAGRTAVIAGTATAVSNRVSRRQAGRWSEQEAQQQAAAQQAAAPQQAAPAPAGDQPDYLAELQELAKLRDAGILTEEEFAAKKSLLLGI
ncbi:MAG TPA: SHOCT domain-containing protein [Miltoncostaeaceae bacterium]|nr:SHOCT domain-containing protein [Miltoncostaeaceae bacterium]